MPRGDETMNIREIATRAQVSTATVSRVLNGNSRVTPELRDRVTRIIEESNYVPNAIARSMNHGKTSILGLILPDITNPFFPGIARGVEDAANTLGYKVILCNTDNHSQTQESYLRILREQRVDGIILVSSSDLSKEQASRTVPDVPIVCCDRAPEAYDTPFVVTDHQMGINLGVNHLVELGHRRIGLISGPTLSSSAMRTQYFIQSLENHGLELPQDAMAVGDYGYDSGYLGMKEILHKSRVTAVFCANDLMAFGAIAAAFEEGFEVPGDISILGYDNIPFSNWCHPPLTSVSQPTYLLGLTAVEMLVEKLTKGVSGTTSCLLEPTLVVRKSTSRAMRSN